jgi:hypothetical protein
MENYKGIFYNDNEEKNYYEGGAHFKYSDLVRELNKLCQEPKKNSSVNILVNSNSQKQGIVIRKNSILNSEGNNSNIKYRKKIDNLNLLTLNNYKDIIIRNNKFVLNKKNNFNIQSGRKRMDLLELINNHLKLSPIRVNNNFNNYKKYYYCKNSLDKDKEKRSSKPMNKFINKTNDNLKLIINNKRTIQNNLPLIESFYYKKLLNQNLININKVSINNSSNKDLKSNKNNLKFIIKFNGIPNIQNQDNKFSPYKNIDNDKNSLFSFKSSDANKNRHNFETIDAIKGRKNYNFGKLAKYFSVNKYIQTKNEK